MASLRLPLAQALDEYKITPDTLWVGFFLYVRGSVDPEQEIRHGFGLSYPGSQGVSAILARETDPHYLGCFSLPVLETFLEEIKEQLSSRPKRLVESTASFLRIKRDFLVVVRQQDREFIESVNAFTLQGAMDRARTEYPSATIAFGGELKDLVDLVEAMRVVCQTQDFASLEVDYRGPINGWLSSKLLMAKRHPELRPGMEQFTEALPEEINV